MIVDSSAIIAIAQKEPGSDRLALHLVQAAEPGIGTPTLVESGIVLTARMGAAGRTHLTRLIQEAQLVEIPFGEEHWPLAISAFYRFGKGRNPAGLNMGDCFTYATAKLAGEPLLALGDDFAQTDLDLVA